MWGCPGGSKTRWGVGASQGLKPGNAASWIVRTEVRTYLRGKGGGKSGGRCNGKGSGRDPEMISE